MIYCFVVVVEKVVYSVGVNAMSRVLKWCCTCKLMNITHGAKTG